MTTLCPRLELRALLDSLLGEFDGYGIGPLVVSRLHHHHVLPECVCSVLLDFVHVDDFSRNFYLVHDSSVDS